MAAIGRSGWGLRAILLIVALSLLANCFIVDPGLDEAPDAAADSNDDGRDHDARDQSDMASEDLDLSEEPILPGDPCPAEPRVCPPQAPICSPFMICQAGVEEDPCASASDCGPTARFCGPDSRCHDGDEGDPCANQGDCSAITYCGPDGVCYDGTEGDPCRINAQCDGNSDCVEGLCD